MPGRRKVSVRQVELLVEFAESNPNVAFGRLPGGPLAVQVSREAWTTVATQLNSVAIGATKTPDQWRRYWIEFKAKTKGKAADSRRNAAATGGGPNKLIPLNELENRVLAILGSVAVEGLPGVRLPSNIPSVDEVADPGYLKNANPDPLSNQSSSTPVRVLKNFSSQSSSPIFSDPLMIVEWLEDPNPSPMDTRPALPSSSETQPAQQQPQVPPLREDTHGDEPPRWAYEIESRRIAAEERLATAMEALVTLIREIRDDVHNY